MVLECGLVVDLSSSMLVLTNNTTKINLLNKKQVGAGKVGQWLRLLLQKNWVRDWFPARMPSLTVIYIFNSRGSHCPRNMHVHITNKEEEEGGAGGGVEGNWKLGVIVPAFNAIIGSWDRKIRDSRPAWAIQWNNDRKQRKQYSWEKLCYENCCLLPGRVHISWPDVPIRIPYLKRTMIVFSPSHRICLSN